MTHNYNVISNGYAFSILNEFFSVFVLAKVLTSPNVPYKLFPTELHLKNGYYLYSTCSNPTNVVLLLVLSMLIGKGA